MEKKGRYVLVLFAGVLLAALTMLSCTGPQGETGATGLQGELGDTYACASCHDEGEELKARQVQYAASVHATGGNFERNGEDCAICHTSQGYQERVAAGNYDDLAEAVANPTAINCRTCHEIHETYTTADWGLRSQDALTLNLTQTAYNAGKSNLCASCHQARWTEVIPDGTAPTADYTGTIHKYWGPHHGTQSNVLTGEGGYSIYTGSDVHYTAVTDGCVSCHMFDAYGAAAGGHTWSMSYEYHGSETANNDSCEGCHTANDIDGFDRISATDNNQTAITALIATAKAALVTNGIMDATDHAVEGTYTNAEAGALWNYLIVIEDRSLGVHNPSFVKFLLETAIAALP